MKKIIFIRHVLTYLTLCIGCLCANASTVSIAFSTGQDHTLEACTATNPSQAIKCSIDNCKSNYPNKSCEFEKLCSPTGWSAIVNINTGSYVKRRYFCGVSEKSLLMMRVKRLCMYSYNNRDNDLFSCEIKTLWNQKGNEISTKYIFDVKHSEIAPQSNLNTGCLITPNSIANISLGMNIRDLRLAISKENIKRNKRKKEVSSLSYKIFLNKYEKENEHITAFVSDTNIITKLKTKHIFCKTKHDIGPGTKIKTAENKLGGLKNIDLNGLIDKQHAFFNDQSENITYLTPNAGIFDFPICGQFGDCRTLSGKPNTDMTGSTIKYKPESIITEVTIFDRKIFSEEIAKSNNRKKCLITADSISDLKIGASIDDIDQAIPNAVVSGNAGSEGSVNYYIYVNNLILLIIYSRDANRITSMRTYNSNCRTAENISPGTLVTTAQDILGDMLYLRRQPIEGQTAKTISEKKYCSKSKTQRFAMFNDQPSTIKYALRCGFKINYNPHSRIKSIIVHEKENEKEKEKWWNDLWINNNENDSSPLER